MTGTPVPTPRAGGGRVVLVGAGPGDPDLITVRGLRLLRSADVVVHDRLVPRELLRGLRVGVEVVDAGKAPGAHRLTQERINEVLVDRALRGSLVVRLKGGDPFLLGRGGEEVLACRAAGVPVEVVPGVSSAFAVPAAADVPVTHRGASRSVTVLTGHDACGAVGGWEADLLARCPGTLVVLMGVGRLRALSELLLAAGRDPATPVAVVENGCTTRQRTTRARLDAVAEVCDRVGVASPAVIVLGDVAAGLEAFAAEHASRGDAMMVR